MDPKQFAEKPIKAARTNKVEPVVTTHMDSDYKLVLCSDTMASKTGLLVIAKLTPKAIKSLPEFWLRWDDKNRELDVDIYLNGENRKDLWSFPGYKGHKTKVDGSEMQEYEVRIKIPGRKVFDGIIRVPLVIGLYRKDTVTISDYRKVKIIS
jgi:hypothetical protein